MKFFSLFSFFFLVQQTFSQIQVGQTIIGEAANDRSGLAISLSRDGTTMAISAPNNVNTTSGQGHVRVFRLENGLWVQVGNDIDETIGRQFGIDIRLNENGTVLIAGAPRTSVGFRDAGIIRVFKLINNNWTQIGNAINGLAVNELFGSHVAINADGTIIASSTTRTRTPNGISSGQIRIYKLENDDWVPFGSFISGDFQNDELGYSLDFTPDGLTLIAGMRRTNGAVKVFKYIDSDWQQVGSTVVGEFINDRFGDSCAINSDGTVFIAGARFNDQIGDNTGNARVFKLINGDWTQIGSTIYSSSAFLSFGYSVDIDDTGTIAVVGSIGSVGLVSIYEYLNDNWILQGTLNGEAEGSFFGYSVSLSGNGNLLSVGSPNIDNPAVDIGKSYTYNISNLLDIESFNNDYFNIVTNFKNKFIQVNLNQANQLKLVNIYSIDGRKIGSFNNSLINTSYFKSGIYIIEALTDKGSGAKKVVIH